MLKNTTKEQDILIKSLRDFVDKSSIDNTHLSLSVDKVADLILCIETLDDKVESVERKLYNANKKLDKLS